MGIAALYPGDVGIAGDGRVVFSEFFADTIGAVIARFDGGSLGTGSMALVTDKPAASQVSTTAVRFAGTGSQNQALYKNLDANYQELWIRWYIKHETLAGSAAWDHPGVTIGGQNPGSDFIIYGFCCDQPTGDEFFTIDVEIRPPSGAGRCLDAYTHWMGMHPTPPGGPGFYFGNTFMPNLHPLTFDQWICMEARVKMNSPVGTPNGELQIWLDGVELINLILGSPVGSWTDSVWTTGSGSGFEGFQWRNTVDLALNFIRLEMYAPSNPGGQTVALRFANVVVATEAIGPLSSEPANTGSPSESFAFPHMRSSRGPMLVMG